jgi:hypothetical protein
MGSMTIHQNCLIALADHNGDVNRGHQTQLCQAFYSVNTLQFTEISKWFVSCGEGAAANPTLRSRPCNACPNAVQYLDVHPSNQSHIKATYTWE